MLQWEGKGIYVKCLLNTKIKEIYARKSPNKENNVTI